MSVDITRELDPDHAPTCPVQRFLPGACDCGGGRAVPPTPESVAAMIVVRQSGLVPVIVCAPGYAWRCQECGWLGTGLTTERDAKREGRRHLADHGVPLCLPGEYGGDHVWVAVRLSDAQKCARCEWEIGK